MQGPEEQLCQINTNCRTLMVLAPAGLSGCRHEFTDDYCSFQALGQLPECFQSHPTGSGSGIPNRFFFAPLR